MAITWARTTLGFGVTKFLETIWVSDLGLFVSVGWGNSYIATSPDGVTWTARTIPDGNSWRSITWSPSLNLLVAVSLDGTNRVMTSPDGITWTSRTAAAANQWMSVRWADSLALFVAVANTGTNRVMTSPDGITWTARATPTPDGGGNQWNALAWSPSLALLVAVGGVNAITSSDGITWTIRSIPGGSGFYLGLDWSEEVGLFVAPTATDMLTSADGTTWTREGTAGGNKIVWAPPPLSLFIATGSGPDLLMSPDGATWTVESPGFGTNTWSETIAYAPSLDVLTLFQTNGSDDDVLHNSVSSVTVDSVLPTIGGTLGADPVTITGIGFVTGATVTFGGTAATDVVVVDDTTITCTIPAHAAGLVDIVVTNVDASTGTLANGFTYSDAATTLTVNAGQSRFVLGPAPSTITTVATVTRGFNNGIITYEWTQVDGPAAATIATPTTLNTDLTFATYIPGSYVFQLAGTTGIPPGALIGFTATSQLTVIIAPTIPPRVTSGGTQVSA